MALFMRDLIAQTWANLRANTLRSFLTMFGIAWGVVSFILLSAVGEGFSRGNRTVLQELGKNIVIIRNGRTSMQAGGERAGRIVRLTFGDVRALQTESALLEHVSPELIRNGLRVKSAYNSSAASMSGIWPVYQYMRTIEVDRGRPISEGDCRDARRVAVLGFDASKQLFADRDPVGMAVTVNALPYTVIGRVRKKQQDSDYTGQDDGRLFIPYETARRDFPLPGRFDTPDHLSAIIASPYPRVTRQVRETIDRETGLISFAALKARGPIESEVRRILAARHGFDAGDPEALSFWNTAIEAVMFDKMIEGMEEFFLAVAIVTLLLGGIGVMNIMLVAVRERTVEIGVRKALGATSSRVLCQFFAEGLLLTGMSGLAGFAVGMGLCGLVNLAPMPTRFSGMVVTWQTGLFAAAALAVVGVAAATYPARRAAALTPIEALRYEA
ncbi:MAG TPA: ABC transporter permease [Vicinamibacterales bacterium]|nr:ABC transporter permease [Vicinamibacterales bacterium]